MNKTVYFRKLRCYLTALDSLLIVVLFSTAMNLQSANATEVTPANEMEEVTVYGEKSLLNLKRALIRAEDNAFDVFNELNTDYQFDIRCEKRKPLGSNIPRRVCFPNYMTDLENEAADRWRGSGRTLNSGQPIISVPKQRRKEKELRNIMEKLKAENPELAEALENYSNAKHRYVTAGGEEE